MIKEVLKDSFPSTFDGPQIPEIDGNGSKVLAVNETGTGVEWVEQYVPPAHPVLTWVRLTGNSTSVPIDTWTPIAMAHTIVETGTYFISYGIDKFGTGAFDFKENAMALTVDAVRQGQTYQYTSNKTASWNFLAGSTILELEADSVVGMDAYQDNGPNTTISIGPECYINMVRIG